VIAKKIIMGCGLREERVPFLRAMGQPKSPSLRVVISRDDGEESELEYWHQAKGYEQFQPSVFFFFLLYHFVVVCV